MYKINVYDDRIKKVIKIRGASAVEKSIPYHNKSYDGLLCELVRVKLENFRRMRFLSFSCHCVWSNLCGYR